jgi:MoaA/NifB/PqqE/SkfB family radical SAM enzyme
MKKKPILPKLGLSVLPFVKKPFIVLFNITGRCNLRCSYCFGHYYSDTNELSLDQVTKILAELYDLGARRLGLGGGEPLLHKNIDDLIRFAIKLGFDVGVNSNGILVPNHLSSLSLVNNLSIGLDGSSPEVHDRYRGKGSFENALRGIQAAREARIPLNFCCTLTEANIDDWPNILELGKKYDALVQVSPLYPQYQGRENKHLPKPVERKKLNEIFHAIIEEKRKGNNIFFSEATYRLILDWPEYEDDTSPVRQAKHPVCLAGKKIVFLDSYGNLFPCARVSNQNEGLNCLEMGVQKAYEGMAAPPCKSCMWACYIEYNSVLNLSLTSIKNFVSSRL